MAQPAHDAVTADGTKVQIKITQGASVGLRAEPEHLLVLQMHADGSTSEVDNGARRPSVGRRRKMQRNGQRPTQP